MGVLYFLKKVGEILKKGLTFWNAYNKIYLWNTESEVKKMSPRTGRPKAENPKNIDVKVRFDEIRHKQLLDYCQKNNLTRTEAIRKGIDLLLEQEKK